MQSHQEIINIFFSAKLTKIIVRVEFPSHSLMISCMLNLSRVHVLVSVRMQVTEGFMQLIHKHTVVGFTKVFMRITSELVVAINHSTNSLHDPFGLINWADDILITVEDSHWNLIDC